MIEPNSDGAKQELKLVPEYGYGVGYRACLLEEKDITPKYKKYVAPVLRTESEIAGFVKDTNDLLYPPILSEFFPTPEEANDEIQRLALILSSLDNETDYSRRGRHRLNSWPDSTPERKRFVNLVRWLTRQSGNNCGPGTGRPFNMIQERFVVIGIGRGEPYFDVRDNDRNWRDPYSKEP